MTHGFDEPAALGAAQLLGDITRERAKILELQQQGHYSDAGQLADNVLRQLNEWLPAGGAAELDIAQVPHVVQGVALLADAAFNSIASGDTAGAAEWMRGLDLFSGQLAGLADRVAGIGMLHCEHGRPSLDGSCLKIPPCTWA